MWSISKLGEVSEKGYILFKQKLMPNFGHGLCTMWAIEISKEIIRRLAKMIKNLLVIRLKLNKRE